jgi:LacI family transcriptional regulator
VSQALSGKPGVSDHTRQRITKAAQELGYVPNALAAQLKNRVTRTIGIMTASGRNQYYSMLVQAIDSGLQPAGYHAVTNDAMRHGSYDATLEAASVDALLAQRVAAIITTYSLSEESVRKLEAWGIPVLFVDSPPPDHAASSPFIGSDNRGGSRKVAEYFASLGIRDTALVAYPGSWGTRFPREEGFTQAATALGISVEVLEAENNADSAFQAVTSFLNDRMPQSIYATNTVLLQGTLRALRMQGLAVPDDVSVVGFDEFEWAELLNPPMTVVDQHIPEIGALAATTVIGLLSADGPTPPVQVELECELVIRDSCRPSRPRQPQTNRKGSTCMQ